MQLTAHAVIKIVWCCSELRKCESMHYGWWYWKTTIDKYCKNKPNKICTCFGYLKAHSLHLFPSFHVLPNRDLHSYLYSYFYIPFWLIQGLSVSLIPLSNLWFLVEFLEKNHTNNPFLCLSTVNTYSLVLLLQKTSWGKYLVVTSEM